MLNRSTLRLAAVLFPAALESPRRAFSCSQRAPFYKPRRLAHRARSLAPSGPRAAPRVPLASAGSTTPKPPRKHRAQHQHAAHQAAECCTGVQRMLRRCGAASPPCPRSRRAAARPSTSCRRCAPPKGSTRCTFSTRSFTQRSTRATPRKADPQSAQEAVCGRPGSAYSPPPRPCPPHGRASIARVGRHNQVMDLRGWNHARAFFFEAFFIESERT